MFDGEVRDQADTSQIESYEPKKSLVVTPDKMQRYYRDTHISKEPYPWHSTFVPLADVIIC
jgi:hypothetical protein